MTIFQSAQHIADYLSANATQKTIILLSGGSSAKVGVKALELLSPEILPSIVISQADERYVPLDSSDLNANLLRSLGLSSVQAPFQPIVADGRQSRDEAALAFSGTLQGWVDKGAQFVAILGLGTDNHTAGILPNTTAAHDNSQLVVSYATDAFERITIGPAFFSNISYAFLYAEGTEKASAVSLLAGELDTRQYPAQLIKKTGGYEVLYNEEAR